MDFDVALAADDDVWVLGVLVGEEVEGEDYGAVGRVFKGDDAVGGVA